jgi:phosphoribosylanthranilate isomerase
MTRLDDVKVAVEHGADAVGFVFWPGSPRAVSVDDVRRIADAIPAGILRVGVFVNQTADEVNATAETAALTHVQLHGDETAAYAATLTRPVIKATSLATLPEHIAWPAETIWLVDAQDTSRRGGTGTLANWPAAAELARTRRVLLAGGLTPENVSAAIARVKPFGIDVSSGVEMSPGIKDPTRIAALMAAVERASRDLMV